MEYSIVKILYNFKSAIWYHVEMSAENTQNQANVKLSEEQFSKSVEDLKKIVETIKTLSGLNDRK